MDEIPEIDNGAVEMAGNDVGDRESDKGSSQDYPNEQLGGVFNNDVVRLLFHRLKEMERRLNEGTAGQISKLQEESRSMEARLKNETINMEVRLRETVEGLTNSLEARLKESVGELETKLHQSVSNLENQIDKKVLIVEKRLEDQIHTNEELVGETIQNIDQKIGEIDNRVIKIQENLEDKLDKSCKIVNDKIGEIKVDLEQRLNENDKIQEELRKTLEQLELNPRGNTPSSVNNDRESLSDVYNTNSCSNQSPEQISSRNWNLGITDVTLPKFGNENGQNPLKFIRDLENFFMIRSVPEHLKLAVAKNCLTGNASCWFEMLGTQEAQYNEFRKKFLGHYWDRNEQTEIRSKLNHGKFNPNGHLKMADYFIQNGQLARLLDPPITPEELINLIADHYAPEIRSAIIVSRPRTYEEMVSLLKELQGHQNSSDSGENRRRTSYGREGAGNLQGRERVEYARGQGPPIREFSNQGPHPQNRPRDRGNPGFTNHNNGNTWNRGNQGNTVRNQWENERRPIEPNTRRPDDRRWNPRVNFLGVDRRPRPYSTENGNREMGMARRTPYENRNYRRQDERFPGPYRRERNDNSSDGEDRPFPPGIDESRVNRLIDDQNARPRSPNHGNNQTRQSEN